MFETIKFSISGDIFYINTNLDVPLKWFLYVLIFFYFCIYYHAKEISKDVLYTQKYLFYCLFFLFLIFSIQHIFFHEQVINNFNKIKEIFKLKLNIEMYYISKYLNFISLIIFSILCINCIYNDFKLKNYKKNFLTIYFYLFIFFITFSLLFNAYLIYLDNMFISLEKHRFLGNSIIGVNGTSLIVNKFVGKSINFINGEFIINNSQVLRLIGTFKEPSSLAFFMSIFLFIDFQKILNNNFKKNLYYVFRVIAFILIIGSGSIKIIFPFLFLYFLFYFFDNRNNYEKFIFFLLPIILSIIVDLFFFKFYYNLISKTFYYILFLINEYSIYNINYSTVNFNREAEFIGKIQNILPNKKLTGIENSNNSNILLFYKILEIFGTGFSSISMKNFYNVMMGFGSFIYLYSLSPIIFLLFNYQILNNLIIINKKKINPKFNISFFNYKYILYQIKKKISFYCILFLSLIYYLIVKDQFSIEIGFLYISLYLSIPEHSNEKF